MEDGSVCHRGRMEEDGWTACRPWRRGQARGSEWLDRLAFQASRNALVCGVAVVPPPPSWLLGCVPGVFLVLDSARALSRAAIRACLPALPRCCRLLPPHPARAISRVPFPPGTDGLASRGCPHFRRPVASWRSSALGALRKGAGGEPCARGRGGRGQRAGRAFSSRLRLWVWRRRWGVSLRGWGASPSSRACRGTAPVLGEASGSEIPRWALAADLRPQVALGTHGARHPAPPPPVPWRWPRVAASRRCPSQSVRPPSVRWPSAAPRGRALVCPASRARRGPDPLLVSPPVRRCRRRRVLDEGSARDPGALRPVRSPERGRPPVCPRGPVAVFRRPASPAPLRGVTDGRRGREAVPGVASFARVPGSAPRAAAGAGGLATGVGWRRGPAPHLVPSAQWRRRAGTLANRGCARDLASSPRVGLGGWASGPVSAFHTPTPGSRLSPRGSSYRPSKRVWPIIPCFPALAFHHLLPPSHPHSSSLVAQTVKRRLQFGEDLV